MSNDMDEIKKRLDALEEKAKVSTTTPTEQKKKRELSKYNIFMTDYLAQRRTEAEKTGQRYDHRLAFSDAAKAWSANKTEK